MAYVFSNYYVTVIQSSVSTAVSYVADLPSSTSYQETLLYSELLTTSIYNALSATEALQMRRGLIQLYTNLEYLIAASTSVTATQRTRVLNRVSAIQAAALSIDTVTASAYDASVKFPSGDPSVTDPGYITWLNSWDFETPPDNVSYLTVLAEAQIDLAAWQALYDSIQGSAVPGITIDAVGTILAAATDSVQSLERLSISADADASTLWNTLVSRPTVTYAAESLICDPTAYGYQALRCLRYSWLYLYAQANQVLVNLRNSTPAKVRTDIVKQGETIMGFAARTLGNFERFTEIIAINGLVPPYFATHRSANVAVPGDKIFLPTGSTTSGSASSAPDYLTGVLGVDIYYGPSGSDMLAWTGDFQTISGYSNLSLSLGRRIATSLGSLQTHPEYGSRIPGELGSIQSSSTSGNLGAYARAAILSDLRVDRIAQLTVTYGSNFSVAVSATAVPIGPGNSTSTVSIAETVASA